MSHDLNAVFYSDTYHPIQAGSIDGTDIASHDNGVYRAMLATSTGLYDPTGDSKAQGNPYCIVFVGRLSRDTTEVTLQEVMRKYGRVKNIRLVRHIVTGASQGYAFVEYETEKEMRHAYEAAHHIKIDGSQVLVDYNRQLLMPGWIPRRLGGGLGGRKESGQLRFGGRDRPFRKPLRPIPEKELERLGIPLPGRYMQRFETPPLPKRRSDWSGDKTMQQENSHRSPEIDLDKVICNEEARYPEDDSRKWHGQRQDKRQVHHEEDDNRSYYERHERREFHKEEDDREKYYRSYHEEGDKRRHRMRHHEEDDERRHHEEDDRRAYRPEEHEKHDKRAYPQEEDDRRKHPERHDKRDYYREDGERWRNDKRHEKRDYFEEVDDMRRHRDKHERRDEVEWSHHHDRHDRRGNLKKEDDRRHHRERKKDGHEQDDNRRHGRTVNCEDDGSQYLKEDGGSKGMDDSRQHKRRHTSRADRVLSNNGSSETDGRSKMRKLQKGKGDGRFESREPSVENRWMHPEGGTHTS